MPLNPRIYDRFLLTSPLTPARVPEELAAAAGPYWLRFQRISDFTFRLRRVITYKNLFRHAFKSVMTISVFGHETGSILEVEIRPHILALAFSCFCLMFLFVFLLCGLIEQSIFAVLFVLGFVLFGYLLLAIRIQIDSEIFTGFLKTFFIRRTDRNRYMITTTHRFRANERYLIAFCP